MRSLNQLRTPEGRVAEPRDDYGLIGGPPPTGHAPISRFREPQIEMAHGAGGKATRRLIDGLFGPILYESLVEDLGAAAQVEIDGALVALTTNSFVVTPLEFPGGSIGELAVNGTVNDLAVGGATAISLVVSFVLESGLKSEVLEREVRAMAEAARAAGVTIVGGDTKVVEPGKTDQMYITTTGVGRFMPGVTLSPQSVKPGDRILLSGPIGDHGITVLLARGELDLQTPINSDTRSVLPMVEAVAAAVGPSIRWMSDPTRGGVATTLNELALDSMLSVHLSEEAIPVRAAVRGACELLRLDPLHIANEGQFLAVIAAEHADAAVAALRSVPGGEEAILIGEIREEPAAAVVVTALNGGSRIVDMLVGDPLPRIC